MSALEQVKETADKVEEKVEGSLTAWGDNARYAIQQAPDYFVWWYTVKSIGLGVAVAFAAYYLGKSRGQAQAQAQLGRASKGRGNYT